VRRTPHGNAALADRGRFPQGGKDSARIIGDQGVDPPLRQGSRSIGIIHGPSTDETALGVRPGDLRFVHELLLGMNAVRAKHPGQNARAHEPRVLGVVQKRPRDTNTCQPDRGEHLGTKAREQNSIALTGRAASEHASDGSTQPPPIGHVTLDLDVQEPASGPNEIDHGIERRDVLPRPHVDLRQRRERRRRDDRRILRDALERRIVDDDDRSIRRIAHVQLHSVGAFVEREREAPQRVLGRASARSSMTEDPGALCASMHARPENSRYVLAGMWDQDATARLARGERLRNEGRYEEAIVVYAEAIQRHPTLAPYRFVIAELSFELQRYADAANVFAEIVRAEPHHAQAWGGLGRAAHLLGEDHHALAALEQAILLAPDWAEPLYEAALLYAERSEHAAAEDRLRRALTRDPKLVAAAEEEGLLVRYPSARP